MCSSEQAEPPSTRVGVVILAAGQGTRMRSPIPKVLHPVAGRPMIEHVLATARSLEAVEIAVVVAPGADELRGALGDVRVVEQARQLGTGHAVLQACRALADRVDRVLVLFGDGPLVRAESVRPLLDQLDRATLALLTVELADPTGYGRIVRTAAGGPVLEIVEEAVADEATRSIREIWSGQLAADAGWLWEHLPRLPERPNGEYYLTDLVEMARQEGRAVAAVRTNDPEEAGGINSQQQLAHANRVAWDRNSARLMASGVTILDPATTYVDASVTVGPGTILYPNTHLQGSTSVGRECKIGPNSIVVDSQIGDGCRVWASVVEGSTLESAVEMGPFSHLRPGCYVGSGVELGNFAEAKNARIGPGSRMHHFSYVGDAELGERVNVGAGSITCNYDGHAKHRTIVGDDAFIGSDSMLVAPLTIGARAMTAAGSVVTRDVPDDTAVRGVPARPFAPRATDSTRDAESKDGE